MKPLRKSAGMPFTIALLITIASLNASFADGGSGNALHFDGVDDYVSVANNSALNTLPITVALWVHTAQSSGAADLVRKPPATLNTGWFLSLSNGVVSAGYSRNSTGHAKVLGTNSVADGAWHHVAFAADSSTIRVYVDGAPQASSTWTGSAGPISDTAEMRLGGPALFSGDLDEVTIWNVALTAADLQSFMNRKLTGSESGLVAYYRCDETNGTQLADSAPGGGSNDGILINGGIFVRSSIPFSPSITTLPATVLTSYGATLNAGANPDGAAARAWFEWGTTTGYGNSTAMQDVGAGTIATNFSQRLLGLATNAYHYRAVASNSFGLTAGADAMFTLTNGPTVASGPVGAGASWDARQPSVELNYIICTNGYFPSDGNVGIPFIGEVCLFAGNFAPAGWTFCNGQLISTNLIGLFGLIGTTYGGEGISNFALPDFTSRTMVGYGQGPGLSPIDIGERLGPSESTLDLFDMPAHAHTLSSPYYMTGSAGLTFPRNNRQSSLGLKCMIFLFGNSPSAAPQTTFEPFIAEMPMFAGNSNPGNPASAQGQLVPISQNGALYSLIGTNFGGNGFTSFGLPDLRGRGPMGDGLGQGLTPRSVGQAPGVESVTLTTAQLPAHQHALAMPPLPAGTGFTGSNQPQSLVQPSFVARFLISTNGEIPSPTVQATNKMIGEIQLYAGTNVPGGWTPCNGQVLDVASYPSLFSIISNFYGGDGVTTFALPNLAGRIPVGAPGGQPGALYGTEQFTLSEAQLPTHSHSVPLLDFQGWCDAYGLLGPAAAFDSDPDADGIKNGLEWATGTNPTNAVSFAPLTIAVVGGQAKLRFTRNTNATDVSVQVQRTANPADANGWSGLVTNVAGAWGIPGIAGETGSGNVKAVEISDPLTNNPAADYRLKISRP